MDNILDLNNYINAEFILVILNCAKYADKRDKQLNTWLKHINIPYFHVIGVEDAPLDIFDSENKILYVSAKDDYNSLPAKVIRTYAYIRRHFPNCKYVLKTDDDQCLTNVKFLPTICNILISKSKYHYGGFVVSVKPHISQYYKIHPELPTNIHIRETKYCSGRFYFLSEEAMDALIRVKDRVESEFLEDYAIGYYLPASLKTKIFNIPTNKYFTDIY